MRKKITIFFLMLSCLFSFYSFEQKDVAWSLEQVHTQFLNGMDEVMLSIEILEKKALDLDVEQGATSQLEEAIINTRLNYKKVEFLLAYFDNYNIKKNINGAPLLTVEPNVPEVVAVEPTGLQVLDELIFSDDPLSSKTEIVNLIKKLKKDFKQVISFQSKVNLTHRHVFESMRQELIRVFTLGVTGFDTPGSANAIPEAQAALSGVYEAFSSYMHLMDKKEMQLQLEMEKQMDETLSYLNDHQSFEGFDRLTFLKKYIEPQYKLLYEIHQKLGVEFIEETTSFPQSVNYHAVSIFGNDFLNTAYFANTDLDDPLIEKRVELGKLLFFDPVLSDNNQRACASCHDPEKAFTDGKTKSLAMNGEGTLDRNAPSLINAVYADKYFWDIREPRLANQMLHVVSSPKEFNSDYVSIINRLNKSPEYKKLFAEAFPEYPKYQLSTHSISEALSNYVASLTDFNSPVDQYIRGERDEIEPAVARGFNLFMGKAACGTCHFAPTFNGSVPPHFDESESEVLGVPATNDTLNPVLDSDLGRFESKLPRDRTDFYKFSFKTVTVRNAALTAPYMHNGVYNTLEEVVDFYNRGGGAGMGMDLPYQTLPFDELNLSAQEQADIVAFMKALTSDMSVFTAPESLPEFTRESGLNDRVIGGEY